MKKTENWCKILNEAEYKKNVVTHSAKGKTLYQAVFGLLARKEVHNVEATDKDIAIMKRTLQIQFKILQLKEK